MLNAVAGFILLVFLLAIVWHWLVAADLGSWLASWFTQG